MCFSPEKSPQEQEPIELPLIMKGYCLLMDKDNIYLPIKAEKNPHEEKTAYLSCMPSFFGGKVEHDEDMHMALAREIKEETQGKIRLDEKILRDENCIPLYEKRDKGEYASIFQQNILFQFYLVDLTKSGIKIWETENDICELSTDQNFSPSCREMACILKISIAELKKNDIKGFLDICREKGKCYVRSNEKMNDPSSTHVKTVAEEWEASHTYKAFDELLKKIKCMKKSL